MPQGQLYLLMHSLQKSPDLRDLTLIDFNWTGAGQPSQINIWKPNLVASFATIPVLYTFIQLLHETTGVLRICIACSTGNAVRWNRASRAEDFQADRYVVRR